mmetsp:Transcript_8954/g.10162  ORF Transcript_8954/g.10162 Transcript_8954/m.10162 type:complete len:147 (+) Transcript_8954:119-559(+)
MISRKFAEVDQVSVDERSPRGHAPRQVHHGHEVELRQFGKFNDTLPGVQDPDPVEPVEDLTTERLAPMTAADHMFFGGKLGTPDSGFSIFLAERTKKIHFIRHAEGYHNVATHQSGDNQCLKRGDQPAAEHELWDARLTPAGIQQA